MFGSKAGGPPSLGLSINTGAANTFGASTPSSQPAAPAAGALFGSAPAAQPATQTNSLFGGNNAASASQPTQAASVFGGQPAQQSQTGGGGLFGSNNNNMTTSQPGGLFGSSTAATTSTGPGIFGSSTAANSQPAQTGALFGTNNTTQQPAASTTTGGIFGQPQQKPASTLFGGPAATSTQATGGGIFGQAQQKPTNSLFGGSTATNSQGGLLGLNNSFGAPQSQQPATLGSTMNPQVVPGVRIDISQIRSTTRFNDLQDDLQNEIARIDAHIQGCISQKEQVDAFIPAHENELDSIPDDVRFVSRKHAAVDSALGADLHAIKAMRDQVRTDADEANLSFHVVQNLTLPPQYHQSLGSSTRQNGGSGANGDDAAEDLVSYFSRITDEMDEHVKRLQKTVREIDSHLGGVEQNISEQASRLQASGGALGAGSQDDRHMELYHVLRDFEEGIVQVATVVGGAREGVTELQMSDFRGRGISSY